MIRGATRKQPWSDAMSDGCTGIDGLLLLSGGERPPEFKAACLQHDKDYYERVKSRLQADRDFYDAMFTAALDVKDPARQLNLLRRAKLRYNVVRLVGGLFWYT